MEGFNESSTSAIELLTNMNEWKFNIITVLSKNRNIFILFDDCQQPPKFKNSKIENLQNLRKNGRHQTILFNYRYRKYHIRL